MEKKPAAQSGDITALLDTTVFGFVGCIAFAILLGVNKEASVATAGALACLSIFFWNGKRSERQ